MSLRRLPYEVVSIVTQSLDLEDIFHLALSCQRFQYLIRDNRSSKAFLELLASGTSEAQEAQKTNQWARAFRCLVKRRQAIRSAAPFTAAIVAVADSWIYEGGVLCYIQGQMIRVLNLHQSNSVEIVLDIHGLLREAVGENRLRQRCKLQLLHYANGLITCLYSRPRESRLLIFDVSSERLLPISPALESTHKIFVRNDAKFLYYGTHSEFGEDGFRRWVLMAYDIQKSQWLDQKVHLMDLVGSDIGQSICFEIIDGYFYGLSNQTKFEVDEVDWTSYYHCFCFPVGKPRPEETLRSVRDKMWRRQHAEGPIDDRWSFIRLIKNEETGELQVLESRKEWLDRRSSGQRIYYTTHLAMPRSSTAINNDCDDAGSEATNAPTTPTVPNTFTNDSGCSTTSSNPLDSGRQVNSMLRERGPPRETTTPLRDPHNTHIGDDASTALLFTFSKCPVRSYHAASQTFLDLVVVDDDDAAKLKLRAGARHATPASALAPDSPALDRKLPHLERIRHLYKNEGANEIVFWPPAAAAAAEEGPDGPALGELARVVSPPSHVGNVRGTWDERSFVYSTGANADGLQAVVFLGFDPAIKLRGLQNWGEQQQGWSGGAPRQDEQQQKQQQQQQQEEEEEAEAEDSQPSHVQATSMQTDARGEAPTEEEGLCKGKGKEVALLPEADDFAATWASGVGSSPQRTTGYSSEDEEPGADADATWSCASPDMFHLQQPHDSSTEGELHWAQKEPAMYQGIGAGFNGLPDFTQLTNIRAEGKIRFGRQ